MHYCESCKALTPETSCTHCGNTLLAAAKADDFCLLTTQDAVFSGMLEDLLKQQSIRYVTQAQEGTAFAMKVNPAGERYRFYVPYAHFEKACELTAELFGE